jgi:RimJ/RimL family protein N-acetyltransferase
VTTPAVLRTPRLVLDALTDADVPALVSLAGDRRIADTMISVPHPLDAAAARQWLDRLRAGAASGTARHWAIRAADTGALVGMATLRAIDREHEEAELSFWIGVASWGRGYATEAAGAVIAHAFTSDGLNRLVAYHMVRNPSSGRVLARLGFRQEGLLRQRVKKWGVYEDVVLAALLRRDWAGGQPADGEPLTFVCPPRRHRP